MCKRPHRQIPPCPNCGTRQHVIIGRTYATYAYQYLCKKCGIGSQSTRSLEHAKGGWWHLSLVWQGINALLAMFILRRDGVWIDEYELTPTQSDWYKRWLSGERVIDLLKEAM